MQTKIKKALEMAEIGQIDGAHHRVWVIDQMVRALIDDEHAYRQWVADYQKGEDGPETYDYDVGIAP